jgi:hypothetical protein
MVGGSPSHSAIKGKLGGRGSWYEVHCAASHPTDILTLTRSREGRCQRREVSPTPATPPRHHCTDFLHRRGGTGEQLQQRRQWFGCPCIECSDPYGIRWSTIPFSTHSFLSLFPILVDHVTGSCDYSQSDEYVPDLSNSTRLSPIKSNSVYSRRSRAHA